MNLSSLSKSVYDETSTVLYNNTPDVIKENMNTVFTTLSSANITNRKLSFTDKFSFAQRKEESDRIVTKFPNKIPIICERVGNDVKDLNRHKYLCPSDITMGDFAYVIRKRLSLEPHRSLFFLVNDGVMFPNSTTLNIVYDTEKNIDGFLYIKYSSENTFG
jgi:GABA(A) receptor-associated protein